MRVFPMLPVWRLTSFTDAQRNLASVTVQNEYSTRKFASGAKGHSYGRPQVAHAGTARRLSMNSSR